MVFEGGIAIGSHGGSYNGFEFVDKNENNISQIEFEPSHDSLVELDLARASGSDSFDL